MSRSDPNTNDRKLFLTGASGVIRSALLKQLPPDQVICLTHREPVLARGVETVRGNIEEKRLGLADDAFRALASRIGCVVHSAAATKFSQPAAKFVRTNIDGTRHVLELARAAGAPLYFVSTAFVHPVRDPSGAAASNAYEESKRSAEEIIGSSGHPATIVRPSVVVGDSMTGEIERYQGFHLILDLVLRQRASLLPGVADAYIDFVPQDVVADFILSLVRAGVVNRDFWLTAGARAPRLGHLIDLAVADASRLLGRPLAAPRLVGPEAFERFAHRTILATQPAAQRIAYKRLSLYAKYLSIVEPLPTSLSSLRYDPDQTLASNVRYWCARNGRAETAAARGAAA